MPSNLSKDSIETLAGRVSGQLEYKPGDDLGPVVEALGGKLVYQQFWELDSSASGSIRIEEQGDFTIYLGMHTSRDRDRFTIAHEIGHYCLHYLYPKLNGKEVGRVSAARYGGGRVEYEANWFAAAFLMPADQFKEAFNSLGQELFLVATKFQVSFSAAQVRAKALGIA